MRSMFLSAALAAIVLSVPSFAAAEKWAIDDAHSSVKFSVRHLMISDVDGRFKKFSGNVETDGDDLTKLKADVAIDVASLDTDNGKRDEHLRSGDFFDAKKWPKMTFKSKKITDVSGGKFRIVGDLTMRDKTHEVTLDAELTPAIKDPWGNMKRGFTASGVLNREDFGMKWNKALEAGGFVVGKDVNLKVQMELQQAKDGKKS